jgi:hypothetical protein
LPGIKQVHRVFDEDGSFFGADAILPGKENPQAKTIFHPFDI